MHAAYLFSLWRLSCVLKLTPRRRFGLMNAFLCKVALTVAECRVVIDPDGCREGSKCRELLDGDGCPIDY